MRASIYHNIARDGHSQMINFGGYRPGHPLVHVLDADVEPPSGSTSTMIAESIYAACNLAPEDVTGRLRTLATGYRHRGQRSLSVGDIVCVGEVALAVGRPAGWEPASGPLAEVRTREHGTSPLPLQGRSPGSGPAPDPRKENHGE